ncbi:MAG: methyltransferase domain-containing protein [Bryobacteraceae bacterium]|nr:methyltransferase domain-containing protein [Bryobacteraceae bacterium]
MPATRSKLEQVLNSEVHLLSAAVALGATSVRTPSPSEERLCTDSARSYDASTLAWLKQQIREGNDPLGEAFLRLRSPAVRRQTGSTYTPIVIVRAMVDWARGRGAPPDRILDPGVGSGRFLLAAAKAFPEAELIGIDVDPLATMIARANIAAMGMADRANVLCGDFRSLSLPASRGRTLYIGNPPYVRHHHLEASWKKWLAEQAAKLGCSASQLAGLHVHFFLATILQSSPADYGCFITAAEWLDVNYGSLLRELFLKDLGGQSLTVLEPTAQAFSDAATTAVVATFEIGSQPKRIRVRRVSRVDEIAPLNSGRPLHRERFESQARWSHLTRRSSPPPPGYIELGELCRVHRGQVTGANRVWIAGPHSVDLPASVLFRTVTKARELFAAAGVLADVSTLRDVIDLPADLSVFEGEDRKRIEGFLRFAKNAGADAGYVAANRRVWWSVGLRSPAPILATYMARRTPAFVVNRVSARHINIAHGLYPREPMSDHLLERLAGYLSRETSLHDGRTYAGGLTKFEPREMERILVPSPEVLLST